MTRIVSTAAEVLADGHIAATNRHSPQSSLRSQAHRF